MEHEGQSPHRRPGTQGSSHQAVTRLVAPGPLASRLVGRLALKQLLLKQKVEERVTHVLPSMCTLKLFSPMCCTDTQASPGSSAAAETPDKQRHQFHCPLGSVPHRRVMVRTAQEGLG